MKKFYNYVYLDPRKPGHYSYDWLPFSFLYEPYYIGKGKGNRCFDHLKQIHSMVNIFKDNKTRKIISEGYQPLIMKLNENLDEQTAFDLETFFIIAIGRKDLKLGPLTNLTSAGGGTTMVSESTRKKLGDLTRGKPKSAEHRKKLSECQKGKIVSNKTRDLLRQAGLGKKLTEETKQKMSKKLKGRKREPMSEETKEKLRQSQRGVPNDPDQNKKISETLKRNGHRPSAYCNEMSRQKLLGVPKSEETKQKLREANLGKKLSEETKQKLREAHHRRRLLLQSSTSVI